MAMMGWLFLIWLLLGMGKGRVGRCLLHDLFNRIQHCLDVIQYLQIGKTHDHKSSVLQELLPNGILLLCILMYWPIDLNDQANFQAAKVDNETFDGQLAAELDSANLSFTQALPEFGFRSGWRFAHLAGERL